MATGLINRVVPITAGGTGQTDVIILSDPNDFLTGGNNITIQSAKIAIWGKVCTLDVQLSRSTNVSSGTTLNLATLAVGYRPSIASPLQTSANGTSFINLSGNLILKLSEAYTADTIIDLRASYILK